MADLGLKRPAGDVDRALGGGGEEKVPSPIRPLLDRDVVGGRGHGVTAKEGVSKMPKENAAPAGGLAPPPAAHGRRSSGRAPPWFPPAAGSHDRRERGG